MSRFTDAPAVRREVPLLGGLMGPSGGGKTMSALRLATGIQRVTGGDIYFIDTESGRALHYADRFKFRHVPFAAPFGSLDYLEALEYVAAKKAGVCIVDSMSHEHEGPGGYIELHDREAERLQPMFKTAEKANLPAWRVPSQNRRRLINTILQMRTNFLFCFRSKEKLRLPSGPGEKVTQMGWMPIAGEEFLFELTVCGLLLPGAKGVPTWQTDFPGEKMMIKAPDQFSWLYEQKGKQLDEATGEALAKWAKGGAVEAAAPGASAVRTVGELAKLLVSKGLASSTERLQWMSNMVGREITAANAGAIEGADLQLLCDKAHELRNGE